MDQIAAYEVKSDHVHYTTKFLDGLKSAVRVLVAIQQPPDLDTAYSLSPCSTKNWEKGPCTASRRRRRHLMDNERTEQTFKSSAFFRFFLIKMQLFCGNKKKNSSRIH
jgi:hypothetical protein